MKTKSKLICVLPLLFVTACASPVRSVHNPEGLRDQDLVIVQHEKIAIMQRDMERREMQMRLDHLKEMQSLQVQRRSSDGHVSCKFFCF